jgi:hypothetical protein
VTESRAEYNGEPCFGGFQGTRNAEDKQKPEVAVKCRQGRGGRVVAFSLSLSLSVCVNNKQVGGRARGEMMMNRPHLLMILHTDQDEEAAHEPNEAIGQGRLRSGKDGPADLTRRVTTAHDTSNEDKKWSLFCQKGEYNGAGEGEGEQRRFVQANGVFIDFERYERINFRFIVRDRPSFGRFDQQPLSKQNKGERRGQRSSKDKARTGSVNQQIGRVRTSKMHFGFLHLCQCTFGAFRND